MIPNSWSFATRGRGGNGRLLPPSASQSWTDSMKNVQAHVQSQCDNSSQNPTHNTRFSSIALPAGQIVSRLSTWGIAVCLLALLMGCSIQKWRHPVEHVLELGASKEEIVTHLNQNVMGSDEHPGLKSWRSNTVRLHVDGVPVALPASIAVQAPRNFRLLVSNPITGGQEADLGSNHERFWIWSKESPQVMTASHEDVGLAIQELEMPVHIHPDWLMEVFGVIPLDPEEFQMKRPQLENGHVELVATRQSPLGEDVERVVRVNVVRGRISEHLLRLPGGKVLARARLEKYTRMPDGIDLPLLITLQWPDARMQMVMDIRNPEVNSANLAANTALWQIPKHGPIVDIGAMARSRRSPQSQSAIGQSAIGQSAIGPEKSIASPKPLDPVRAKVRLADSPSPNAVQQASSLSEAPARQSTASTKTTISTKTEDDLPEWAK